MNSKFEILRQVLEGVEKTGKIGTGTQSVSHAVAQEVASDLLKMFPEEDSEHVKAYRSLLYLVDYLNENQFEGVEAYHIDTPTVQEQLHRIRGEVEKDAIDDIVERFEVDSTHTNSLGDRRIDNTTITDPVSKIQTNVSTAPKGSEMLKQRKEMTAWEVLEAPL